MAMNFTQLNNLNIAGLSDVISLTVGLVGELQRGITIMGGVVNKSPIVTFTAKDKALRKRVGCGGEYKYENMSDDVKYYDMQPVEMPIVICLDDLWGKMVATGIHLSEDFGETQLAVFMAGEVLKVLEADLLRLAWLDGIVEDDPAYGIFKKGGIIKQMLSSTETIVAFSLTEASVEDTMKKLIDTQRPDQKEKSEFFVSSNVMRIFKNMVQKKDNTTAQSHFEDGKTSYTLEGYLINELPHVSAAAIADEADVDAFIAFTPKTNIQIALEDATLPIAPFKQDAKDEMYYSRTKFAADIMVAVESILKLATKAKTVTPPEEG